MTDLLIKCSVCGAILDEEDLFCPNCGTETPLTTHGPRTKDNGQTAVPPSAPASRVSTFNFTCRGCGASMSYDASAGTLRCPFCGSEDLDHTLDAKEIAADGVMPFAIEREQAVAAMRDYLGRGFWRPGDLAAQAAVVIMTPVYVPYWVFTARTQTYWTADTSQTPPGARGDWYPLTGKHSSDYRGLLIGASAVLTHSETAAISPFDLADAVPPDQVDLDNITYERFSVPRKYARPLARQGLEVEEAKACRQYVPGDGRNMKVNVRIWDLSSRPMLLPVWIMAYRYRDRVFRFLVNGQTGRPAGQAPLSFQKIGVAVAIAVIAIIVLLLLLSRASRGDEPASFAPVASGILPSSQQAYTAGEPLCANPSCTLLSPPSKTTTIACCARSGWPTWSDSGPSPNGLASPWTPLVSAAKR